MRRVFIGCLLFTLVACAAVRVPAAYIRERHPYRERFYANFDRTLTAVEVALTARGWTLEQEVDPSVYEGWPGGDLYERQVLLITKSREHDRLVGKGVARLNIYIRNRRDISEVELRYVAVTHYRIKGFTRYQDDEVAEAFFALLRQELPAAAPPQTAS